MRNSQLFIGLAFAASLALAVGSCGSSSNANADGSSSGSGNGLTCPQGSTSSCTQAELNTYDNCIISACGSSLGMCYGSGFQSGSFSGPCGSFGQCASKCSCGDTACSNACGTPSSACQSCLLGNVVSCFLTANCQQPACLTGGSGAGGSTGGGTGGKAGGVGGSTGTSGTCADLNTCCNSIANASIKAQCMSEYSLLMPMGDAACGAAVSGLRQAGACQ